MIKPKHYIPKRNKRLELYLNNPEYEKVCREAEAKNMRIGPFMRELILEGLNG